MKRVLLIVSALALSAVALSAVAQAASAADFAENFRDFILGADAATRKRPQIERVDEISARCLFCHEGRRGSNRATGRGPGIGGKAGGHSIGMDYAAVAQRRPREYRPATSLDPNIRLVAGKVGCATCHRLEAAPGSGEDRPEAVRISAAEPEMCRATRELTMGARDRELCMGCHIK